MILLNTHTHLNGKKIMWKRLKSERSLKGFVPNETELLLNWPVQSWRAQPFSDYFAGQ